jgi:hypothetical protein
MNNEVKLGFYFARVLNSDRLTIVGCWGDRIEKQVNEDVEILEKVPADVIKICSKGVKILNLDKFVKEKE